MPTQEERLTALERFQKEAAAHIRETEENTAISLGVIRDQGRDIKRIVQRLDTMDDRLDTIDGRLGTFDEQLGALDGRLGTFGEQLGALDGRLNTLEQHMESRYETLDKKFDQALQLLTT